MLPATLAQEVKKQVQHYLGATFHMRLPQSEQALEAFFNHPEDGLFKGPWVQVKRPFRLAEDYGAQYFDLNIPFIPFKHQWHSWKRLTTKGGNKPKHTLVTTGTGSGKTECFLYPLLDKVLITTYTTNLSVTIKTLMEKLAPEVVDRIEITNLHQLARTICQRIQWYGRVTEPADLSAIWDKVFEANKDTGFERQLVEDEYHEVIDPMGVDTEEAYLTAIRTGRPRISRGQRKKLWRLFVAFNQELSKRNLLRSSSRTVVLDKAARISNSLRFNRLYPKKNSNFPYL